jgi:hypothetical protein
VLLEHLLALPPRARARVRVGGPLPRAALRVSRCAAASPAGADLTVNDSTAPPLPDEIQKEYNKVKLSIRDTNGDKMTYEKIYIPAVDPQNKEATPDMQLALAEDVVKQLKSGANFAELAKKHSRDANALAPVLQEIAARGLLFVDSRTTGNSAGSAVAQSQGVAHAVRDVFLDNEIDATSVRKQLAELERVANRRGTAVAIGHPHDATLEALAAWIPTMNARGLQLVPVSAVVRQQRQAPASPNLAPASLVPASLAPVAGREPPSPSPPTRAATVTRAIPEPAAAIAGEPPWKRFPTE